MRSLPVRPSLRHLKLEAKRRLAAGEFVTLHDAQAAIAREHGLPSWARLKQACAQNGAAGDGPALGHLRWIVERFSGADGPGWTPPGERITDPRLKAARPSRTLGQPPDGISQIAARACAGLGLPALLVAGGDPGRAPWTVATGHADLDRDEPLPPGHRFPVPGVTALVTGTAVLRLVAGGRLELDEPANGRLRSVRLADDAVTVRELLSHTGGVDSPAELYADSVPELAELMGPVIACSGARGTVSPSNGGICVLGQLVADVTGLPYAEAASRLVLEPLGMRDSRFPAKAVDIGPDAVTGYTATRDGALEPFPARVSTMQAVAGLWAAGADLVRLGTGWSSLLPAALARAALAPQAESGPTGIRAGLGWLLDGKTAAHAGAGFEAITLLRSRVRDRRTYVVLTSRAVTVESLDDSLRRTWLTA
jgi:CubicO group peptidase (beta-lactamase class C family)